MPTPTSAPYRFHDQLIYNIHAGLLPMSEIIGQTTIKLGNPVLLKTRARSDGNFYT